MCMYCEKNKTLTDIMLPITALEYCCVYLVKNQNYAGRVVVAYKDHKTELFQLTAMERDGFCKELALVAEVIYELFDAQKLNYGIYGDGVPHLHCHIAPKKETAYGWGAPFTLTGNDTFPDEAELNDRVANIKQRIQEKL